ncbi:hypothetical protein [Acinetobacter lwoffii]|uniref:hypothetical protein n=1 Tax=Acinetobacter lwoffii TaxID=28090 RepID=UPI0021F959B3|nr:hypothetical protein ABWED_1732 [Acinetobacter lwoffii]
MNSQTKSSDEIKSLILKNLLEIFDQLQYFSNNNNMIKKYTTHIHFDSLKDLINFLREDHLSQSSINNYDEYILSYINNIATNIKSKTLRIFHTKSEEIINEFIEELLNSIIIFCNSTLELLSNHLIIKNRYNEEIKYNLDKIKSLKLENDSLKSDFTIVGKEVLELKNSLTKNNEKLIKIINKNDELTLNLSKSNEELQNVTVEKNRIQAELLQFENEPTTTAYDEAAVKYTDLHEKFRNFFYFSLTGIIFVIFIMIYLKSNIIPLINFTLVNNNDQVEYWIIKISLMLIGMTLANYFLKQSSHYQRLADQHHQTSVELKAYPYFMNSVPLEHSIEIRKELALKYFGKEIDSASHKNMSNLISDQMKSTTDMVKATTDVIKNINVQKPGS